MHEKAKEYLALADNDTSDSLDDKSFVSVRPDHMFVTYIVSRIECPFLIVSGFVPYRLIEFNEELYRQLFDVP
jgi:hypothetical protein